MRFYEKLSIIAIIIITMSMPCFSADPYTSNYTGIEIDAALEKTTYITVTQAIDLDALSECNNRAEMTRDIDGTILLANIDQYYKITGDYTGLSLTGFTLTTAGVLKYTGPGECLLLIGTSDFSVDKACKTHYALYLNGELAPGVSETPHTFLAQNKTANISIVGLIALQTDDEVEVYAKSDTINTTLNPETLKVVLWSN